MFAILLCTLIISNNVFATLESEKHGRKVSQEAGRGGTKKSKRDMTQEGGSNAAEAIKPPTVGNEEAGLSHTNYQVKADEALKALVDEFKGRKKYAIEPTTIFQGIETKIPIEPPTTTVQTTEMSTTTPTEPPTTTVKTTEMSKTTPASSTKKKLPKCKKKTTKAPATTQNNTTGDNKTMEESRSAMNYLLNNLPTLLKSKILITDGSEESVLEGYAKSQSVPSEVLSAYNESRKEERQLYRRLLAISGSSSPHLTETYKALRKGKVWNYTKLDERFKAFFQKPSVALTEFEALKAQEFEFFDKQVDQMLNEELPGDSPTPAESKSLRQSFLNELPGPLKTKIQLTDEAEDKVLESYAKSQTVPSETISEYNKSKKEERELLKQFLALAGASAAQILATYKMLRDGVAWSYTKANEKFRPFFNSPSTALTEYEALKRDEFETIDAFLNGSPQGKVDAGSSKSPTGGTETSPNPKRLEDTKAERAMARAEMQDTVRRAYRRKRAESAGAKEAASAEELKQRHFRYKDVKTTRGDDALKAGRAVHIETNADDVDRFTHISQRDPRDLDPSTVTTHASRHAKKGRSRRPNDRLYINKPLWLGLLALMITAVTIRVACWKRVTDWLTKNKKKGESLNPGDGRPETVKSI